jgi:thiol-disulfide isomerase/thioredoxin
MILRLRALNALAFILLVVPVHMIAQPMPQPAPRTPSEAYERATQPLRDFEKSAEPTIEANAQAWKEHEQRARSYAVLFKVEGWKGEQLLSLAQLYAAAGQSAGAERAYVLYLKDPKATHPALARKGLIDVLFTQEKWKDAVAVARELLAEPKYDQEIILNIHALVDAIRLSDPQSANALSEKMLPGLFQYAERVVSTSNLSAHAAEMLVYGLEPAAIYRERGAVARSEASITSFMSRLAASPLSSNKLIRERVELSVLQIRLLGATAPAIDGITYVGLHKISLTDLKGKVVMLDFWAHWCAPCIASFPAVNALRAKYEAKGFIILGVTELYGFLGERKAVGADEELAALRSLRKAHGVSYGFIVGPHRNQAAYGVMGLPEVALIDRAGRVRYVRSGTGEGKAFEKMIESLLAEVQPAQ